MCQILSGCRTIDNNNDLLLLLSYPHKSSNFNTTTSHHYHSSLPVIVPYSGACLSYQSISKYIEQRWGHHAALTQSYIYIINYFFYIYLLILTHPYSSLTRTKDLTPNPICSQHLPPCQLVYYSMLFYELTSE